MRGCLRDPPAHATHLTDIELEGNALDDTSNPGEDWDILVEGNGTPLVFSGILMDPLVSDNVFFTGGSKDIQDVSEWRWTIGTTPDKDDLINAYAAVYASRHFYFGADRFAQTGSSELGIWFLQDHVSPMADGTFTGHHQPGDILVLSNFVNGGKISEIDVWRWVGGTEPLELLAAGNDCTVTDQEYLVCATVNQLSTDAPWPYTPKAGDPNVFPAGAFLEGGIDLPTLLPNFGCFNHVVFETRSSHSIDAQLKDFVGGSFDTCAVDVYKDGPALSKIGDEVTWTFTFDNQSIFPMYLESVTDTLLGDLTATARTAGCGTLATKGEPASACSFEVTTVVPAGAKDPLTNTVTVLYNDAPDFTRTDVLGEATHSVNLFQPGASLTKDGTFMTVVGGTATYDFTLANIGSSDSPALVLDSFVDVGVGWTGLGDLFDAAVDAGCDLLAVGEECTFSVDHLVPTGTPNPMVDVATATFHPEGFPNVITATDDHSVRLFEPSLALSFTGSTTLSKIGDGVTVAITLENTSEPDTPQLVLVSAIDDVLGDLTELARAAGCDGLDPGATCHLEVAYVVPAGAPDPLTGALTVTFSPSGYPDTFAATLPWTVDLFQPSLTLTMTGDAFGLAGEPIEYAYVLTNTSSADSPALVLDSLFDTVKGDLSGLATGCSTLSPGDFCAFGYEHVLGWEEPDPLVNAAVAHYHPAGFPNDIVADASVETNLFQPSVSVTVAADELSKVGDLVTCVVSISNNGSADSPPLALVAVVDEVLGDLTATARAHGCDPLAAGASCTFEVGHVVLETDPDPLTSTLHVIYGLTDYRTQLAAGAWWTTNLFQPSVVADISGDTLGEIDYEAHYVITFINTSSADSPPLVLDSVKDSLLGDLGPLAGVCATLPAGASCTFPATRTILPEDPDPLVDTMVGHFHPLGFPNDIWASDDHLIELFHAGFVIDKSGNVLSKVGDPVTYRFEITNLSSGDTPPLVLDTFDDSLMGSLYTQATAAGCGSLTPGGRCSFEVTRTVAPDDPDPLVNIATAVYHPLGFRSTWSASEQHVTNLFQPSIALKKFGDLLGIVGEPVHYEVTVMNTSSPDTPTLVLDSLEDSLVGALGGCNVLPPGGTCTVAFERTVLGTDPDPLENIAVAHYHPEGFPNDISAVASHSTNLFQPALVVEVRADELSKIGDAIHYAITITNLSSPDSPALALGKVTDTVLGDLTGPARLAGCTILVPSESCSFTAARVVLPTAPDPLVGELTATYTPHGYATTFSAASPWTTNLFQPSLAADIRGDTLGEVGYGAQYVITLTNTSSADSPALALDFVTDTLLGHLNPIALGCETLPSGASCTFTTTRTILATDPDPLTDTLIAHYHPLGFPNDIWATDGHAIELFQANLTITKSGTTLSKIGDDVTYRFEVTNTSSADTPPLTLAAFDDSLIGSIMTPALDAGCGELVAGASCAFELTRTVATGDPDPLLNVASVVYHPFGFQSTWVAVDDHATNLFQPALALDKSCDARGIAGEPVHYTVTLTNLSSADTPTLVLDSLVDTLVGDLAGSAPACKMLPPGGACTFEYTRIALETDPDPLGNLVVAHMHPEGFPNDITASCDCWTELFQPGLIAKVGTPERSKIGDPATYDIVLANVGSPDSPPLALVSVSDMVLGDLTAQAIGAGCGTLVPGTACTFEVVHVVQPTDGDPLVGTLTALYDLVGFTTPVHATAEHTIQLFQPAVAVDVTGEALSEIGATVHYVLTVTNLSSADSPPLVLDSITDTLLGNLGTVAGPCGQLDAGMSCTFTVERTIAVGDPDPLTNFTTVHYHPQGFPNDITDDDGHVVELFQAGVDVTKTGDDLSKIGDTVHYTFAITATGSADTPPLALVSVKDSTLGDLTAEAIRSGCDPLVPGATCGFTVTRVVAAGDPDPLVNTVVVTYHPTGFTSTWTDSATHAVNLFQPAVSLALVGDAYSKHGDVAHYEITVVNGSSADSPALTCSLTDALLGLDGTSTFVTLPGETEVFTFEHTVVEPPDPDPLVNTTTLHCSVDGFPNVLDRSATHTTDLVHPELTLEKTCLTDPVPVGAAANFRIDLENPGDVPLIVHVTDELIDIDRVITLAPMPPAGCTMDEDPSDGCYSVEGGVIVEVGGVITNVADATATLPAKYGLDNVLTVTDGAECQVRSGATRTPGFWKTHVSFTCHIFQTHLGNVMNLGWTTLYGCDDAFGIFWAQSTPELKLGKRSKVCQARVHASFHLVAAILNSELDNAEPVPIDPSSGYDLITAARIALARGDIRQIQRIAELLANYNESGDGVAILDLDGMLIDHADPKLARKTADFSAVMCK